MSGPLDKAVFLGCALDCDEQYDSIQEKVKMMSQPGQADNPYELVLKILRRRVVQAEFEELGSLKIPSWLRPKPELSDLSRINAESFISFMEKGGCQKTAQQIAGLTTTILPKIPCLIGVDHSLSGGTLKAVTDYYGREHVAVIILDSHTDAIPVNTTLGAIHYDLETNTDSVHDSQDPLLYNRLDSYNASSFLHGLLADGVLLPENLYLIGICDYPSQRAFRINDQRIIDYLKVFTELKAQGVHLLSKHDCQKNPSKVRTVLNRIKTPYLYVSIDMDVGANAALEGVRFRNWQGLTEKQMLKFGSMLANTVRSRTQLVGLDISEIDSRRAGRVTASGEDRTLLIAAELIARIVFRANT